MDLFINILLGVVVWGAILYPSSKKSLKLHLIIGTILLTVGISSLIAHNYVGAFISLIGTANDYWLAWKKHKDKARP